MNLLELEKNYEEGSLPKKQYIEQMYLNHDCFFQYSEFIKSRDIQKIEVTDGSVILTTRDQGIKLICERYDERIAPFEILNFKFYEKEESDFIFKLVNDNDVVFDIGGNIGYYSIALSKSKSNIVIHAFEPIPKTYEIFIGNVKLNGVDINIHKLGLSNKPQELDFYFYKEGSVNASARKLNEEHDSTKITCQVDTLDNFVRENNVHNIDFIKCDIEGAELFTFLGAKESIKKFKPIIFTEMLRKWSAKFDYHPNDIIELLASLGYQCYFVSNGNLKKIDIVTDETLETNFFFLNLEKHKNEISKFCL